MTEETCAALIGSEGGASATATASYIGPAEMDDPDPRFVCTDGGAVIDHGVTRRAVGSARLSRAALRLRTSAFLDAKFEGEYHSLRPRVGKISIIIGSLKRGVGRWQVLCGVDSAPIWPVGGLVVRSAGAQVVAAFRMGLARHRSSSSSSPWGRLVSGGGVELEGLLPGWCDGRGLGRQPECVEERADGSRLCECGNDGALRALASCRCSRGTRRCRSGTRGCPREFSVRTPRCRHRGRAVVGQRPVGE